MKRKLLHLFAVCMAMVTAIPIANAAQITFSVNTTPLWKKEGTYNGAKTIAVSNDKLYLLLQPSTDTGIMYVGQNTNWTSFDSGYGTWAHGFAFDNDDAGNIVMQGNSTGSATTKLVVYPAGATSNSGKKEITITSPGGRTDYFRIQGNILSGKAYVWFVPQNTQNIIRVNIENGKEVGQTTWTHTLGANSSTELAYMLDDGRIFLHHRKGSPNYAYILTVPANGGAVTASEEILSGDGASNLTSDVFNIQGTYFYVYNAGNTTQDIRFNVKNLATGKDIATNITPFDGKKADSDGTISYLSEFNSVGTIMRPIKVNVNTVDLYCYTPEHGASVYRVLANIVAEAANSISASRVEGTIDNIKVSWTKPTNDEPTSYAVSYSNNGGSTWSSDVKTTNLTHTFTGLAPGTYTFRVVPYYEQYLTYGGEKTSNSVELITCTDPVTNVTVAYNNNVGNSIVVSWDAPNGVIAPNKYQVCYSTNGGTSWSTPVETTNLTYTFDNLAVGPYTFKVTPIYNGSAGEEAASGNINALAPTGHELIVTRKWTEGIAGTVDGAKNMAVSNDRVYLASPNYAALPYVGPNVKDKIDPTTGNWPNLSTDYAVGRVGFSMDNDDAGNIIVKTGNYYGNEATQFSIFPAGATTKDGEKKISVTGDYAPGGRADYIGAQGDLYNGTGYIWLIPQNAQKVVRITVVKGATSAITTWPLESNIASAEVIVRPFDGNRLYYHHQGTGYGIITLPEPNTTITSNLIENISVTGSPYSNLSSDMFTLQGNLLQVRNAGEGSQDISFCIANLSNNGELLKYNDKTSITPFDGTTSSLSRVGSLVRAVKVDDYNYDVYSYSPGFGADCYRVTANPVFTITGAIQSLDYEYSSTETEEGIRQDVVLTWTAPENAFPTSYNIYRNGSFLKSVDGSTLTYTDKNINENYTYKVVPYFAGIAEDASLGLEVTTTEVENILYAPEITEVRNYDGYSIVEIFYKMPAESKTKPVYYNIYRNGVLLETGLTQYNFIDNQLPKVLEDIDYTYTVEAVYGADYNNETRTSEKMVVTVKARDWSLSGYQLQEVYNIPITQAIGNLPNNFTNHEYYRQGHFYNGSWYIAQRADNLSKKDDPNYTASDKGTEIVSGVAGTTGGVVSIKAIEGNDVLTGFTGKPITSEAFASVGLAIDDAGNIFMRYNNDNNADMATTAPAIDKITGLPVSWLTYVADGFTRRITRGAIYKRNADGTYETTPSIINLNTLWTSNDWINTMAFTYQNGSVGDKNGQVTGRSDYYSMYGDVMSAEGGYLILSPSWTRTIFKIKIANGQYVNHETHQIDQYQSANGMVSVKTGTENYGFKLDGRNAWMAQIRSNGYFGIHGEEENHEDGHEHETHAIFVADSRINTSGGTSIVAFDNPATAENDGETFLITPVSMYSRNQGDFIVTRGTKTSITDLASEAKFMPPMPVAQMKQTSINSNVATNANGNWFHAEVGTYESATGEQSECVYIYQYVPGIRFAKYRLVSDLTLPVVYPTLEIKTAYNDDETDITHFDGIVTWERPQGFGITNADEASVWIKSYTVELVDAKGNVVETVEVKSDVEDENGNCEFNYFEYLAGLGKSTSDCELDFQTYTARVAVNYELKNGDIQQSSFNYATDNNDYDAAPATDAIKWLFKGNETLKDYVWEEQGEKWVIVEKPVDVYRVELDFNKPDNNITDEPVSYYTIKAYVNGSKKDVIQIKDFHLHKGIEVVNGIEQAILDRDEKGNVIPTSQIPGDYDFDTQKAPYYHKVGDDYGVGGQSRTTSVLTWHHKVPKGYYTGGVATVAEVDEESEEIIITDEPSKWVFVVEAHYAASNRSITKIEETQFNTERSPNDDDEYISTGVEVVGDNALALKIYPIPATTSITVKASEAINSIVIYNEAGVEVINEMGNGENITMVNIENLSTGFYFVKVNNYEPVKIIKK